MDTPVSTFIKLMRGPHRFLLESVEKGTQRGRYSILGDTALYQILVKNGHLRIIDDQDQVTEYNDGDPFLYLKTFYQRFIHPTLNHIPFINGGLFGYLGYDCVRYIEKLPDQSRDDTRLADIHLFVPQRIVVFDNLLNTISLIVFVKPAQSSKSEYAAAVRMLQNMQKCILAASLFKTEPPVSAKKISVTSNVSKAQFQDLVVKAKEYIKRGDVFQVVLSQRLRVTSQARPFDIYRGLRVVNPSPYMFYMEMGRTSLLGSSPETLVKLDQGNVKVKPIAGTCKRGETEQQDRELIEALLRDPKERAEHTMLVDLGRNDVGRICKYGSVRVEDLMSIEKYSHVIHIVSSVEGKLNENMDSIDVFKACFPAGTVSGAPKVRAMEIIDHLEPNRRSIYAGAVGYFSFNGDMDVCIAIRTIYIHNGNIYLQAGAGIVADSVPEREYRETYNKAMGLLKAVEYAQGGLV
ncbi:anthranilate synthase component I [candidate division KSB1 bacterium]|nr:anthranilate synthase component I [candidate division KSB1 bacterium]